MEKMICRQGMADTSQAWIYYKESGRGTPILMLHGNAETHLIFDYYEKKLSMNYRVILMDSRAHGRSRIKPEYAESEFTTTDMARDAAALLDILHIPSCILFGFSDGANIALEYASLFPDRTRAVIAISGNVSPNGLIHPVRAFCVGKCARPQEFSHRLPEKAPPLLSDNNISRCRTPGQERSARRERYFR